MAKKRLCAVCGSEYSFCPNCGNNKGNEPWRYLFDNENCREIYHIYDKFRSDVITSDVAKEELKKHNLEKVLTANTLVSEVLKGLYEIKKEEPIAAVENGDDAKDKVDVDATQPKSDFTADEPRKNNANKHIKYTNKK